METLAASSAAGEVFLYQAEAFQETPLQASNTRLIASPSPRWTIFGGWRTKRTGQDLAGAPA